MGQLDPALAQWVLGEARRRGATAAEILLVSAESMAAGVGWAKSKSSKAPASGGSGYACLLIIFSQRFDG